MSLIGWIIRIGVVLGVLSVVHYLATGRLPFGTPQLLQDGDASETLVED
jgi:hypothetical protein